MKPKATRKNDAVAESAIKSIVNAFKEKDNFLITAHVNPEGDSIGSQLAAYHIL